MKTIDLELPVHTLCTRHPELVGVLEQLGFTDITKPGMLSTAGRFMTIPKGAALKKLDLEMIKAALAAQGYQAADKEAGQ